MKHKKTHSAPHQSSGGAAKRPAPSARDVHKITADSSASKADSAAAFSSAQDTRGKSPTNACTDAAAALGSQTDTSSRTASDGLSGSNAYAASGSSSRSNAYAASGSQPDTNAPASEHPSGTNASSISGIPLGADSPGISSGAYAQAASGTPSGRGTPPLSGTPSAAEAASEQTPQDVSRRIFSGEEQPVGKQRFIKNNLYFTICIYVLVMLIASAFIFKAVIDINQTKAWLGQIASVLSPFIFGALLAYVLNPMVHVFFRWIDWLVKKLKLRLPHTVHVVLSILITYVIVLGFVVLVLTYVMPELMGNVPDFIKFVQEAYADLLTLLTELQDRFPELDISAVQKSLNDVVPDLISTMQNFAANMVPAIYSVSMWITNWIVNLLLTIIVSIYMLYDKKRLMRACWKIIYAFLPNKHIPACHTILAECNRLFSSFVVGKFIDSAIIGALCFILMTLLQLPYALFISVIVGITNMIPYFGPFIGAIPGILILLFVRPVSALIFAFMILCLQQFDGLILGPKILGDSTGMKPLWIIFAITVGGSMFGVIGMFLGVPVVAILNYLMDLYLEYRLKKKNIPESLVDEAIKHMQLDE